MNTIKKILDKVQHFNVSRNGDTDYLNIASKRAIFGLSILAGIAGIITLVKYTITMGDTIPLFAKLALYSSPVFFVFAFMIVKQVPVRTVAILFGIFTFVKMGITVGSLHSLENVQGLMLIPLCVLMTLILGRKEGAIAVLATFGIYAYLYINGTNGVVSVVGESGLGAQVFRLGITICLTVAGAALFRHEMVRAMTGASEALVKAEAATEKAEQATAKLKSSQKLLSEVIENIPAGILIFDKDDKFVLSNKAYRDAVPYIADKLRPGLPLPEFVEGFYDALNGVKTENPVLDELHRTDKPAWIEKQISYYRDSKEFDHHDDTGWTRVIDRRLDDGTFIGLRVDITELKEHEAELEQAQQKANASNIAKSEFLANMSHEIRTPMNGILGMAELLTGCELGMEERNFVDIIVKSGNALVTIINDILDFSKIEAGQIDLDIHPFSLRESVEDVASLISSKAAEKDLELLVHVDHDLPQFFMADAGRFRQVLTNLVGNAIKFTDEGHVYVEVTGTTENETTHLKIRVEDTGIGIPDDQVDDIFEKFSQVDGSSTRRHEGTGLGLAIVTNIVKLMGGEVAAVSELGKGSVFWITMPLVKAECPEKIEIPAVDIAGMTAMVVDDNWINLEIVEKQLKHWNCQCVTVSSGAEALTSLGDIYAQGGKIDLLILDYQMPEMNGEELLTTLKQSEDFKHIPAIVLTSVDQGSLAMSLKKKGADGYLIKPTRSAALYNTIVKCVSKRQLQEVQAASGHTPELQNSTVPETADIIAMAAHVDGKGSGASVATAVNQPVTEDAKMTDLDILVAEDNEVNQMYMRFILDKTNLSYEIVENGQLAVDKYKTAQPKVILMDVSMPIMNGHEATKEIRSLEAGSDHRALIIGITAHAQERDRLLCLEAGMDDYLTKPLSAKVFKQRLAHWNIIDGDSNQTRAQQKAEI